jgi:uncharacterized membrane-anchored protein YitT (DUF2179 family)
MGTELRRKINKSKVLAEIKNILFVILGCSILAFADAAFLTPGNIISGGVVSVGIICQYYYAQGPAWLFGLTDINDIVVTFVQVILWVIGWFTLGKKFSLNTLVASVSYPLIYALLFRFNIGQVIGLDALFEGANAGKAELMLAGIFGGALAGAGVAVSYLGNGSTGGFDIVSFIIAKYSEMKQDVSGFIIDASLIVIGMICMKDVIQGLIGILAALSCAVAVQYIYVNADTFVIVDILSDHYEEIQDYIHKDMDHATTVIDTIGGYTGEKRKMIRVVIYQVETTELRSKIAEIDPKAFVSFMQAKTINGEGFEPFIVPRKPGLHRSHRENHEAQYDAERMAEEAKANAKKQKPTQKPAVSTQKPAEKSGEKAEEKPASKSAEKPASKPAEPAEKKAAMPIKETKDEKGAA